MKSLRVTEAGKAPAFEDLAAAPLNAGDIRVDIKACGLNFADLLMIKGSYQDTPDLPFTLGMELAGRVIETSQDVTHINVGDRVAIMAGSGGLAQSGVFKAARAIKIPDVMSYEHAAAFQVAYGTSQVALDYKAKLQPGETLLVLGAAGGVGLTAVEIGKLMGATVIACARGPEKLKICKAAGADHVIDSTTEDIREVVKALGGADVVYDAVGGAQFKDAMRATNVDGRMLTIGFASGEVPNIPANHLLVKNISVMGLYWGKYIDVKPDVITASNATLFNWYEAGHITPHISKTFPLEAAQDALDFLKARKSTGKVVVTMGD
ncbi:MAG: NADPH:quinone oxidoreductase family protein [Halocynthiibacter sp.]